jgi:prepilin peptidase CpaA
MISLIIFFTFILSILGVGILAGLSDLRGLMIPNSYSLFILATFFPCFALLWLLGGSAIFFSFFSHIFAAIFVFVATAVLFQFRFIGGADSKLATAYALWVGLSGLAAFFFIMTLVGALLGVFALFLKRRRPFKAPLAGSWIARVQDGENKVPYGIAIVIGAAYGFYHVGYFDFERLAIVLAL